MYSPEAFHIFELLDCFNTNSEAFLFLNCFTTDFPKLFNYVVRDVIVSVSISYFVGLSGTV
jgi:hypothetical protein